MASNQDQDAEGAAEATLRLLNSSLAALIRRSSTHEANLRRFAWACAQFALRTCKMHDSVLEDAVKYAQAGITLDNTVRWQHLRQEVARIVERLDDVAFRAQDLSGEADGSSDGYLSAFRAARAASSVLACLNASARTAAIEACYESYHATERNDTLIQIAKETLSR